MSQSVVLAWLDRLDPGTHRRIKGLRLVTAFGLASMLGRMPDIVAGLTHGAALSSLAGWFALWASVSEARFTRLDSTRDLILLCAAAALGSASYIVLAPMLQSVGPAGSELALISGAFLVGYLKRFGLTGAGIGSQLFIGQLLAYGGEMTAADLPAVTVAALLAAIASIVPRVLSGPAEIPALPPPADNDRFRGPAGLAPELTMGLQAAVGALVIVAMNEYGGLEESAWAITACTYVIAGSAKGTIDRIRQRMIGTVIGVPLGLICLPLAVDLPLLIWMAAALAMVVYAMALPERYDIACGAFAFTLMVTLAASGEHSVVLLASRAWETALGGAVGLAAALLVLPIRPIRVSS